MYFHRGEGVAGIGARDLTAYGAGFHHRVDQEFLGDTMGIGFGVESEQEEESRMSHRLHGVDVEFSNVCEYAVGMGVAEAVFATKFYAVGHIHSL